jgi:hypothetical protein
MIWGRLRHALSTPQALTSRTDVVKKQDGTNKSEILRRRETAASRGNLLRGALS